jgi:predicted NAD-dependent protein-ADP-ribosyltransferase YbiA (DUF1768 family)
MYRCTLTVKDDIMGDVEWPSAEALFQAMRFADPLIREEIRQQRSGMGAKIVAKKNADKMVVTPLSLLDLKNMEYVLRLKLEQHTELKELLKATGDEVIVEDVTRRSSPGRHTFWGMALKDGEWQGENTLGKMWMLLRFELIGKL